MYIKQLVELWEIFKLSLAQSTGTEVLRPGRRLGVRGSGPAQCHGQRLPHWQAAAGAPAYQLSPPGMPGLHTRAVALHRLACGARTDCRSCPGRYALESQSIPLMTSLSTPLRVMSLETLYVGQLLQLELQWPPRRQRLSDELEDTSPLDFFGPPAACQCGTAAVTRVTRDSDWQPQPEGCRCLALAAVEGAVTTEG